MVLLEMKMKRKIALVLPLALGCALAAGVASSAQDTSNVPKTVGPFVAYCATNFKGCGGSSSTAARDTCAAVLELRHHQTRGQHPRDLRSRRMRSCLGAATASFWVRAIVAPATRDACAAVLELRRPIGQLLQEDGYDLAMHAQLSWSCDLANGTTEMAFGGRSRRMRSCLGAATLASASIASPPAPARDACAAVLELRQPPGNGELLAFWLATHAQLSWSCDKCRR